MNPWNIGEGPSKADAMDAAARVAKAMAHGTRVSMLELLAQADRSVGELADLGGVKLTTASAHLQLLRDVGLVVSSREGTTTVCSLAGDHVAELLARLYDVVAPVAPSAVAAAAVAGTSHEVVLDVRPPAEFAHGHLEGAINIPLDGLAQRLGDLPPDASFVVYCRGRFCALSHDAVEILRAHGRTARVSEAGVLEWRSAQLELVS